MTKKPFTQDDLKTIYDQNGLLSLDLLAGNLQGWTIDDIKRRLYQWRMRGVITYRLEDDELLDFDFLKNKKQKQADITAGRRLKLEEYFKQLQATAEIIAKTTASDTNRLKAIQLQQVALNEIPDDIYTELVEITA